MPSRHRQFLSYLVLATYAGIALVGDGLHSLLPDGHHHHHGLYVVGHSCNDPQHAGHHHDDVACCSSENAGLTASDSDADSHLCEVCVFLAHAVSQPTEFVEPCDSQPLIVAAHVEPQPIYSPTSLGPQAPRGPPLFLA